MFRFLKNWSLTIKLNIYDTNCFGRASSDSDETAVIYDTADEHTYSITIGKNLDDSGRRIESLVNGKGYIYLKLDEETRTVKSVRHISKSDDYNYLICSEEAAKLVMN